MKRIFGESKVYQLDNICFRTVMKQIFLNRLQENSYFFFIYLKVEIRKSYLFFVFSEMVAASISNPGSHTQRWAHSLIARKILTSQQIIPIKIA